MPSAFRRGFVSLPRQHVLSRASALPALIAVLALAAAPPGAAVAATGPVPGDAPPEAIGEVAVRAGDVAPVGVRVPSQFGCTLGITAGGGFVFCDALGSAAYLREAGTTTLLAYKGEQVPGGTILWIRSAVPSPDGAVFLVAQLSAGLDVVLLRIPPGGEAPTPVLMRGQSLEVPGGSVTYMGMPWPMGVAVDGAGRAIVHAAIDFTDGAIVRVPPSGPPEVLVRIGEALGSGTIERLASAPGVSPSGLVVFAAELDTGDQVIATVQPGSAPVALQTFAANPAGWPGPLDYSTPVVNDAGDVAFLRGWDATEMELRGVVGGIQRILAAPGSPLPGDDAISSVCCAPIVIDATGTVLFGAYGEIGSDGLYRVTDTIDAVVQSGDDLGGGVGLSTIHLLPSPALANDGTVVFAAWDTSGGYGLFSTTDTTIRRELSAGDPVAGPGRFMSVASSGGIFFASILPSPPLRDPHPVVPFPYQGVGPSLSHGGRMIFDAMLLGGARGLFLREPDGTLSVVALDGDPAPGGGVFDGPYLSYHSVNDAGTVAFLARTFANRLALFYGPAGGPLDRLLGTGDSVPGSVETVLGFLPPSRVDAGGSLAIPLSLSDGTVVLLGWDGARLVRVAGPGDVIPGRGAIQSVMTGASDRLLPPILDGTGGVVFEAVTETGGQALYRAPLAPGGAASAVRLIGQGDAVEGGVLSSLVLQALDLDAAGRLAFQTPAPGGSGSTVEAVTYVLDPGGTARRVVGPGDALPGAGTVTAVVPHLATAGNDRLVHAVEGPKLLVSRLTAGGGPGGFQTGVLAGSGMPAPDGGYYLSQPYVTPAIGPGPPAPPGVSLETRPADEPTYTTRIVPDRLASDGDHLVAWHAVTTVSPDVIVLFDLNVNHAPHAEAYSQNVVECAGPDGTPVTLDGGGSYDPDADPITYEWSGPFGSVMGARPTVILPLGSSNVELTVRDARGASSSTTVQVLVRDTTPPIVTAVASPARIWPPNARLTPVEITLTAADTCDAAPQVTLSGIAVTDRKGAGDSSDVVGASVGTDDRAFEVLARGGGGRDGRTYTATYTVVDASGNPATADAVVQVAPPSHGREEAAARRM
jgi:hypothetical protein